MTKNSKPTGSKEYADIEYSKELAELFPDAEWWHWEDIEDGIITFQNHKSNSGLFYDYPAITIQSALDLIPTATEIYKGREDYTVTHDLKCMNYCFEDKSLLNALCKCLIYLRKEGLL